MPNNYKRKVNTRSPETFIVIAVEGKKTEPEYFENIKNELKNGNIKLEILPPLEGDSAPQNILKKLLLKLKDYSKTDSFWLVCDVDRHNNLNVVIKDAKNNNIQIAISNPCFEVWLYLYCGDIKIAGSMVYFDETELEEQEELNSQKMKTIYGKSKSKHCNNHQIAIERAQNLTKTAGAKNFLTEAEHRGKTNVYKLVQAILDNNNEDKNKYPNRTVAFSGTVAPLNLF